MSDLLTEALAAAQRRGHQLLPTLERWVRRNSYSADIEGVNAVGDMIADDFSIDGLELDRVSGTEVGDHLVFTTPAWRQNAGKRVVLIGHHDTVFPPGTFDVWERDGDRLRGPGVLDMKGGLAVIHATLTALAEAGALAGLPLAFITVGDEEIGSPDSRPLLEKTAEGASAALVFEAGRVSDQIITRRKGTGKMQVRVQGKAAHAGNHHADGINAIRALARFIDAAEDLTDYDRGVTVNVGLVSGGSAANTVAAAAECLIDFRMIRRSDGEALVQSLDELAREIGRSSGATFTLTGGIKRLPLERSDASVALYRRYATAAEAAGLGHAECELIGGGSDANTVSAMGVPSIDGLGPRGRGFHTHDEYIEVSTLPQRVDALIRFLLAWGES